ncbi:hypothetical protein Tco_0531801 [Tanacetum coccineum]
MTKAQDQRLHIMKEQAYNKDKDQDQESKIQRQSNLYKSKEARFKDLASEEIVILKILSQKLKLVEPTVPCGDRYIYPSEGVNGEDGMVILEHESGMFFHNCFKGKMRHHQGIEDNLKTCFLANAKTVGRHKNLEAEGQRFIRDSQCLGEPMSSLIQQA